MGSGAEEKAYHRTGLGKYLVIVISLHVRDRFRGEKRKKNVHPEIVCNSLLSFKLL